MMKKNRNFFTKPANVVKTSMLLLVFFAVTTYVHGQTMVYNTAGSHRFEVTGAQVTKIEVYGAGGAGIGKSDGGIGGGGGGYASLSGITTNHIATGSILKVNVGAGGTNGGSGGNSSVDYGRGHVTAYGGAGASANYQGGGGSTQYIMNGSSYSSSVTAAGCTFTTYKGGNGGTNWSAGIANYAGGGGGAAGPNGNGGNGETASALEGNGDGGASGGGVGGAGGDGKNSNNNGENGGNYGGGGGGCKDNKTPGKGGTGYVAIHYIIVKSTVSFNAQGGTGAPSTLNNVIYGTKLGDYYSGNWVPTRPGYLFLGWNTESDGSGEYYGPHSASAFETNTTLYAIWLKEIVLEDMIVCRDEQIVLSDIPDGYSSFEWSPADAFSNTGSRTTLDASELNVGENTIQVTAIFDEVFNGDFNSGTQGIFSNYAYQETPCADKCLNPERRWGIITKFSDGSSDWVDYDDRTGHGGEGDHFMFVNGGWVSPENGYGAMEAFWEQTVRVTPGQEYTFSFWMMGMGMGNPARVYVFINGVQINTDAFSYTNPQWEQHTVQWNSGTNTSATIQLKNMEWNYPGNDFGIDDISFTCGTSDISTTSSCTITVLPEVTAPTTITATAVQVCEGENITFTATGGTGASDAIVWSKTGCPQTAYINDFHQFDYSLYQTQDASVNSSGNLVVTSTGVDPMITMYNLGSFDPNTYKYFQIRYRVTSGTANEVEIFFTNAQYAAAAAAQRISGNLISDGEWHTLTIDASTAPLWTHSNITGWRYDYCTNSGVTMEIDFIALTNAPASGNTYTMSNLSQGTHTVYANRLSSCNSDPCITKQVSTYPEFNPGKINTTGQEICEGGTANPIGISTSASGGNGNISYQWYVNDIAISGATSASYTPSSTYTSVAGTYTFTRKAKGSCSDWQTSNGSYILTVNKAEVTLNDISPVAICKGESTRLEATLNGTPIGGVSYQWTPATGLSSTTGSAVTANPTTTTTYTVTATANNNGCTAISTKTVTVTVNELPTLNVTPTDALCYGSNDGKLTVNVGGSAPAYKIYMGGISGTLQTTLTAAGSHEISSLTPGNYTIAVEDGNGCQTTSAVQTINQPSALSLSSVTATAVKCYGGNGSVALTVSGGTTPYRYAWSNGATSEDLSSVPAGTYTVTVTDANGCTIAAQTATVEEPALLTANITSQTNVGCYGNNNGTITVNATGGIAPYQYKIDGAFSSNNTFRNLTAGNYTITIKDKNGCETSVSTSITEPDGTLNASIESQTNVSCKGGSNGSVTILAQSGTAPYQYKLNNGSWQSSATFSGLSKNSYIATVKDNNGCEISLTVNITEPEQLAIVQQGDITSVRCKGESNGAFAFKVNGGTLNYTITIAGPAGNVALASPISDVYTQTGLAAGTYTVSVTDANECTAEAEFSISEPAKVMTVTITGTTQESCDGNDATATALADGGNNGYTYLWSDGQTTALAARLTTMEANNGVYSVTATDSKGCAATASVTITLNNPLAMEDITGPVVCTGTEFSITPQNGTNGTILDGTTYSWPAPDAISGIGGLAAGTDRPSINGVLTNTNNTPQTVSYVVTPKNGVCVGNAVGVSVTVTTTVNPNVTIDMPNVMTVCSNADNFLLTANFVNSNSSFTAVWKKDGNTIATHNGTAGNNSDSYEVDLANDTCKGQYTYRVEYTDESGCTASDECIITVNSGGWSISQLAGSATVECVSAATEPAESLLPVVEDGCGRTTTRTFLSRESNPTEITCAGTVTYTYRYTACDDTYKDWTYTYTINDVTNPTIAADAITTKVANIDQTACKFSIPDLTADIRAKASDNCTEAADLVISQSPAMGTVITAATDVVVTVTDKCGNSTTHTVNVTVPTLPTATIESTNILCHGNTTGSATVTPANGTAPYTYLWSNGQTVATATGLDNKEYTVTVTDANRCSTTASVTITEPAALAETTATVPVDCYGNSTGSATITVTGGTPNYSVIVNEVTKSGNDALTFENLPKGTYPVTIKDANNCELTGVSVTITEPEALAISAELTQVKCKDGSNGAIDLTVTGGNGSYQYVWNNDATTQDLTNLTAGEYNVTVKDAKNCSISGTYTIDEPELLQITSITPTNITCPSGNDGKIEVTVNGGTIPYSYQLNGGTAQPTAVFNALIAGSYTVTVTDANGCSTTSSTTLTQPAPLALTGCPTDITKNTDADKSYATVTWTEPTFSPIDNGATLNVTGKTATNQYPVGTTTITYTVTNTCGESQSCSFTITVSDNQAPKITCAVTGNQDVLPNSAGNTYTHSGNSWNATATDNVYVTSLTYTLTGATVDNTPKTTLDGQVFNYGTTTVTWKATDNTGAFDVCSFQVVVADNTKPELKCPTITAEYECLASVPAAYANYEAFADAGGEATDNHQINESSFAVTETETTGCPTTITRTYSIKDMTGNEGTCTQVITVEDKTAPALTDSWPANITGQNNCFDDANISGLLSDEAVAALYTDNCGGDITVTHEDANTSEDDCGWTITRTYTIKDACNNAVTKTMSVSGSDQTAPVLKVADSWPANITGQNNCFDDANISGLLSDEAVAALYTDNCGGDITVTHEDANTSEDDCGWTITRTYTIKDACNNTVTPAPTMSVSGSDQTAPALTGEWPDNITGQDNCFANAVTSGLYTDDQVKALYSDCSTITVEHSDANTLTSDCGWTITRTYTIKDACNNTVTPAPTMSVSGSDQTAPALTGEWPDNITGQDNCFANAVTSGLYTDDQVKALYSDCSTITVEHSDANTLTSDCGWTITRTYTIKDACNNTVTPAPTMSVSGSDQTAPALTGEWPDNITGQDNCFANAVTSGLYTDAQVKALYTDCSEITVTHTDANTSEDDCGWTITRTYTIKDACGNTVTPSPKMSVSGSDQTAPALKEGVTWPLDITGQNNCFANADLTVLYSNDQVKELYSDCSTITVTHEDANTSEDNCGWTITRTYTIKDACGNTVTPSPKMSVSGSDQTAPAIGTDDLDSTLTSTNCVFKIPDLTTEVRNISNDLCTPNADLIISQSPAAGTVLAQTDAAQNVTVTVTVKDLCGNESTKEVVVVVPTMMTVTATADPATICYGATSQLTATPSNVVGTATYNWTPSDGLNNATIANPVATLTTTTTYTVEVTDENGCAATATTTVNVNPEVVMDTVAPMTLCVGDVTSYSFTTPLTVGTMSYAWTNSNTAIGLVANGDGDIPSFTPTNTMNAPINATITVTPSHTYNDITCQGDSITFHITVRPSITTPGNVTFTCPADTTVVLSYSECEQFVNIGEPEFENHMSGMNVNITNDAPEGNIFPEGTTIVTWTATDECGAALTCTQSVVIQFPSCGDSIADFDGYRYSSVRIGCQCWTGENARSEHYSDGTPVDNFRYYNDSDSLESVYGKLYSWYAAVRVPEGDDTAVPADSIDQLGRPYVQGVCPEGWALPTVDEYMLMIANSGNATHAKDGSNLHWLPGYEGQSPLSGFDAFGAGMYNEALARYEGLLGKTYFWTTLNVPGSETATTVEINYYCVEGLQTELSKFDGVSIRCIRKK